MTIKELIAFTGKSERTIRVWIKKANIVRYAETAQRIEIDYTIEEVEEILNAGSMSKDAVTILMQNARQPTAIVPNQNNLEMVKMMSDIMAQSMATALKPLYDRLDRIEENQTPKQLLLPEVEQEEPRAYLNRLCREYSQIKKVDFQTGWNILYTEMLYRCKINVKVRAKNEGIKPIDYLEQNNLLLTGCSIMKGLINV